MWNLKYNTNEFIYKTETDSQTQKTNLQLPKGRKQGRDKLGIWDYQIHTTYVIDTQQGFTVQHWDLYSISSNILSWKRS